MPACVDPWLSIAAERGTYDYCYICLPTMPSALFIQNVKVSTIRRVPPISYNQFSFPAYSQLNTIYHLLPSHDALYGIVGEKHNGQPKSWCEPVRLFVWSCALSCHCFVSLLILVFLFLLRFLFFVHVCRSPAMWKSRRHN